MKLTELRYTFSSYATTNPPTSQSRTLELHTNGDLTLLQSEAVNGTITTKVYAITEEQYEAICRDFEELNIAEEAKALLKALPQQESPLTGGYTTESFSFTADGNSVDLRSMPLGGTVLIFRLYALLPTCKVLSEIHSGKETYPYFTPPVPMMNPESPSPPAPKPKPVVRQTPDGEVWDCPICGNENNPGKFCPECGSPRD